MNGFISNVKGSQLKMSLSVCRFFGNNVIFSPVFKNIVIIINPAFVNDINISPVTGSDIISSDRERFLLNGPMAPSSKFQWAIQKINGSYQKPNGPFFTCIFVETRCCMLRRAKNTPTRSFVSRTVNRK